MSIKSTLNYKRKFQNFDRLNSLILLLIIKVIIFLFRLNLSKIILPFHTHTKKNLSHSSQVNYFYLIHSLFVQIQNLPHFKILETHFHVTSNLDIPKSYTVKSNV